MPESHAPTLAVIGGGQLARMMAQPAIALGLPLRLLAEAEGVSAAQVVVDQLVGDYRDLATLRRVTDGCPVVTFDHEHVPTEHLHALEADGVAVRPGPEALVHAQDKAVMRRRLAELDVPIDVLPGEPALWYLVIGLTLYNSVIVAEILRAGVASLPRGQGEAGRAIGMTEGQVMRAILLPQAFRTMLPALISQLVVILKDTSLAAVIGLGYFELLRRGNQISQVLDNPIQSLFIVGTIFVVINYGLSRLAVYVEKRLSTSSYSDPDPATAQITLEAQSRGGGPG